MEVRDEYKRREQAWITYIAPNQNPKKMKKSIKAFWPIGEQRNQGPTENMIQTIRAAKDKYLKELKEKENG